MGYNPSRFTKGRFVQVSTGIIVPFMFNPTTVARDHGWSWSEQAIPGRSHPFYQGGTGMAESISFTLFLDGDRGRSDRRRSLAEVGFQDVPIDLSPEINQLRQLKLPHDVEFDGAYGVPDRLLLNLGTWFSGQVQLDSVNDRVTEWTPKLEPLRAEVDIEAHVIVESNETDWLFFSSEPSNALTERPEVLPRPESDS